MPRPTKTTEFYFGMLGDPTLEVENKLLHMYLKAVSTIYNRARQQQVPILVLREQPLARYEPVFKAIYDGEIDFGSLNEQIKARAKNAGIKHIVEAHSDKEFLTLVTSPFPHPSPPPWRVVYWSDTFLELLPARERVLIRKIRHKEAPFQYRVISRIDMMRREADNGNYDMRIELDLPDINRGRLFWPPEANEQPTLHIR